MLLKGVILLMVVACRASPSLPSSFHLSSEKYHLYRTIVSSYNVLKQEWDVFKERHDKNYDTDEEDMRRMEIFARNKLFIAKHNDLYEKGVVTFTVKMNKFGDLTTDEFNEIYGLKTDDFDEEDMRYEESTFIPPYGVETAKQKDWRKEGAVTDVKNQGKCGSCWAFSAAGALEAQYYRKSKHLVGLSEQNLIDCSTDFGNSGCKGGWPRKAFNYTKVNHGIDTERSYPYRGTAGTCRYNATYSVTSPKGYRKLDRNEHHLEIAVGSIGPVSVLIDAHGDAFRFYNNGVHFNATCSSTLKNLNHAVLVVGYGIAECGSQYWLVKNSWGKDWGDEGYIKMAKNRNYNCGIVTEAVFPII